MMLERNTNLTIKSLNTMKNASLTEKQLAAINGADQALYLGARLLVLSSHAKSVKRTYNKVAYDVTVFPALDLAMGEVVLVTRTGLTGGMGYGELPQPGTWETSSDGNWMFLKPQEDDPAVKSMVQWGIKYLLPGIVEGSAVKRCFYLEIRSVTYVAGRGPVSMEGSVEARTAEITNTAFKPHSLRSWGGDAHFVKAEELGELLKEFNNNTLQPVTVKGNESLFRIR